MMRRALLFLAVLLLAAPATAQTLGIGPETGRPLPRFESLRFNEVNLRRGAGEDYPIAWTFLRKGLPVEIFQEFGLWRHVRDHDGATGWVKRNQLSAVRTAFVQAEGATLHEQANVDSRVVAQAEQGAVLTLSKCAVNWCEAEAQGYSGWVRKEGLWGVTEDEVFED